MNDITFDELKLLNCSHNMIGVFEPLINSEKEVYSFNVKFLNNLFIKEFKNIEFPEQNVDKISIYLHELMIKCISKFNNGYKTIINNVNIDDKSYVMQCSKFQDKYLMCTLYGDDEIMINKEQCLIDRNFVESSMDIILVVDKDGKILYGNKKAVQTYGYTYNELLSLSVFDLRNQDIREHTEKQLQQALKKGIKFKTYHYRKDGSRFPVHVRSIYSNEQSKNIVVSIVRDISNTEKILEEAKMFSASLDIFEDAIIVLTKEFNISHWSKGAEEKLGYKSEEMIGKGIEVLIPINKGDGFRNKIDKVKNGDVINNFETVRIHKNGSSIDVSISISPIYDFDGIFSGAVGVYKDITEKKELAKKLQEYEERWRFALEGSKFGAWDWNIVTNKVFYSNGWKELLGYDEYEISDNLEEWMSRVHPDDSSYVKDKLNKHFQGEEYSLEYRMKCKDSSYKWVRSRGKAIDWIASGKPLRMVGTVEDVSDTKIIEQELKEKYRQLKLLKEEADRANNAKSEFLANISHEIRTPMNGISAAIQLLQVTNISSEQSKYVKILKESLDTLLVIINNLLDISKIESGGFKLNNEKFNLKEIVNDIYNNFLITGNSKGLEISYYLDPTIDFEVIGDEFKLKQILTNLLSNAVKFTENGYVSLRVKLVHSDCISERIEFRVKDSGIGIEEDFRDKMFKNFSQGDLSSKKKHMGAGLGLAISKQLATLMNGDIWFESTVGQGSTFFFTCEFKKSNKKSNDILQQKNEVYNLDYDKVILCVEDNIINQEVIEDIIRKKGYKYIAAYNGNEALEVLKNNKVDLILMDVQMPEMNGFEITKTVREEDSKVRHIPIIGMTAYSMFESRDKCIKAGMDDYIAKPLDIEKLYNIIGNHLEKSNKKSDGIYENNIVKEISKVNNWEQDKVILSVDDNIISQELMENIIRGKGYKYIAAYNGNEALEILKSNKIDLILMDAQMPELNGFETTKAIRENEDRRNPIPIIAITAFAMPDDKEKCIEAGMDAYISKPFDIQELYSIVETYLQ